MIPKVTSWDFVIKQHQCGLLLILTRGEINDSHTFKKLNAKLTSQGLKVSRIEDGIYITGSLETTCQDLLKFANKALTNLDKAVHVNLDAWLMHFFQQSLTNINLKALSKFIKGKTNDFQGCLSRPQMDMMIEAGYYENVTIEHLSLPKLSFIKLKNAFYEQSSIATGLH